MRERIFTKSILAGKLFGSYVAKSVMNITNTLWSRYVDGVGNDITNTTKAVWSVVTRTGNGEYYFPVWYWNLRDKRNLVQFFFCYIAMKSNREWGHFSSLRVNAKSVRMSKGRAKNIDVVDRRWLEFRICSCPAVVSVGARFLRCDDTIGGYRWSRCPTTLKWKYSKFYFCKTTKLRFK